MKHFGFPTKIFARKVTSNEHLAILVSSTVPFTPCYVVEASSQQAPRRERSAHDSF